jgi:SAM-dependent methyltransferase
MAEIRSFKKEDGRELPVSDDFLLPFLSPTSPGTKYWDSPPPGPMNQRLLGRMVLQLHQALALFRKCGVDLRGKKFLDIGTGTGLTPRMMLEFSEIESAVGADPYRIGEHAAGTRTTDEDEAFQSMKSFILEHSPGALDYENYRNLMGYEHHTLAPDRFEYREQPPKTYRFEQIGAHDLDQLDEKFDLFYVKAIDHIPDWEGIFRAVAAVAEPGAIFCIKHFSFFSYLGPHRYATTNIPWGHLLLSDDEYRRFAHEFHGERAEKMIDFYFNGLSYPRTPVPELVRMAQRQGFAPHAIINEPLRNFSEFQGFTEVVDDFWNIVRENWPGLGADEMFSGRYHIVLRRL